METFADRLRALIGEASQSEFARRCGIGESSLRQYLAGSIPGIDKAVQIASGTGASLEWLITGESSRDSATGASHKVAGTQPEHTGVPMLQVANAESLEEGAFVLLPRMNVSAAAGAGRLAPAHPEIESYVALSQEYLRSIGVPPRYAQLLEISGDSMFPTLKDRDVAVVDTSITEVVSDAVYAVSYGGLILAKRVQIARDGSVTLSSDNKGAGYRDERIPSGELYDLHIVGRIKGRLGSL